MCNISIRHSFRSLIKDLSVLIAIILFCGSAEYFPSKARSETSLSDYDYAFEMGYVDSKWVGEDPERQIFSAEFKTMLTRMIEALAPDQLEWFNSKISEDNIPVSREVGTVMSWYAAVALGQDDYNAGFDVSIVFNDEYNEDEEELNRMFSLLPEAWAPTTVYVPNSTQTWGIEQGAAVSWNVSHISTRTGTQTIPFDTEKGSMHFLDPLTVFDAVSAVSKLWDSCVSTSSKRFETSIAESLPMYSRDEIVSVNYQNQDVLIQRAQDMRQRLVDRQPEDLQAALEMGIINEELLKRSDELATERETAAMVQAALKAGPGLESNFLTAVIMDQEDPHLEDSATRYWFCVLVGYTFDEWYSHRECDGDWKAFLDTFVLDEGYFVTQASGPLGIYVDNPEAYIPKDYIGRIGNAHSLEDICLDVGSWIAQPSSDQIPYHNSTVEPMFPMAKTASLYDLTTGDKVLMDFGDGSFRPFEIMTIGEVATASLRYARSFEKEAELVPWEEVGRYNQDIITEELLQKDTTLPYNDCRNLPSSWRGMLLGKLATVNNYSLGTDTDHMVHSEELDIFKSAGINFVRLGLSFSRLQGQNKTGEDGKVNLTRLNELDRVIAWCMERDIHVNLAAADLPNYYQYWNVSGAEYWSWNEKMGEGPQTDKEIADFAAFWGMLARRYSDIPNEYLSFNIQNEPYVENEDDYLRKYSPAVEEIRKYSPDRTIIADIHNPDTINGEAMASLGVALSSHFYQPIGFMEPSQEGDYSAEYITSVEWPGKYESIRYYFTGVDMPGIVAYDTVKSTAEKYGVGFMVGEFGILVLDEFTGAYAHERYKDETIYGYYQEVISAFEEDGVPWCFGISNSPYGLYQLLPLYDTEYEQVGMFYVDAKMREFLKSYQE